MAVEEYMTARELQTELILAVKKLGYNEVDDELILDQTGNLILDQDARRIFSD